MNPALRSTLAATILFASATALFAQSATTYNPLQNSIATPRPFDAATSSGNPNALTVSPANPYLGSVPAGPIVPGVLSLSMHDAVVRALHANLGLLDTEQDHAQSRAARMRALSVLLPQLSAEAAEVFRNFPINTIGGQKLGLPNLIPNFNYQTAAVNYRQSIVDVSALHELRATRQEEEMSAAALADSRNIVVLAATSTYLQVAASQSRVKAAQSELDSSRALESLLQDRVKREVSPEIEAIRATVTRQTAEQRLALAEVRLEKDKLALTRIIGLQLEQEFTLTDSAGFEPEPQLSLDELLASASTGREDLKSATARVEYARQLLKAQSSQRLPTLDVRANGGETGVNFGHVYGTYEVEGRVSVPIFTGRRIEAGVISAQATLKRREAELADLQQRSKYDVRSSLLDLKAADKSVEIAAANLKLAQEGLRESNDRYQAGVSNSLELIQAQQVVSSAEDNEIASTYAHSLAKLMLLRSTGTAEHEYMTYMGVR